MTLPDSDIEAIYWLSGLYGARTATSRRPSAFKLRTCRVAIAAETLDWAANWLQINGWNEPLVAARKLREAAGRFMSSKGAKS